jgi:nucleotide-binding universal stress UspA family protein
MKGVVMRRVLVPTDFSAATWLVAREVQSWVHAIAGELVLLHVVPDVYCPWFGDASLIFIDDSKVAEAYADLRAQGLRRLSAWLPPWSDESCRTLVEVGPTADTIMQVAQVEAVEMIIMRAPKRRWWRPAFLGSVTDTVRCRASVPVVVWSGLGDGLPHRGGRAVGLAAAAEHVRDPRLSDVEWNHL